MPQTNLCGVNTGGVVGAGMEDDNRVLWGIVQVLQHAIKVQTAFPCIPVTVCAEVGEASQLEDKSVVAWHGNKNGYFKAGQLKLENKNKFTFISSYPSC